MKIIHITLAVAMVAACTALAVYLAGCNQRVTRVVTINILSQIPRAWLVLQTDEELTVAIIDGGNLFFGPRSGMASAVRRSHWGLNLEKVAGEDIVVSGREVRIKLPDPEVFDSVIDMGTYRFIMRRSGLQAIADAICGRSLMQELVEIAFQTQPKPSPELIQARRADFVRRLNEKTAALFEAKGLVVRFE